MAAEYMKSPSMTFLQELRFPSSENVLISLSCSPVSNCFNLKMKEKKRVVCLFYDQHRSKGYLTVLRLSQLMTPEFGEHWSTSPGTERWD